MRYSIKRSLLVFAYLGIILSGYAQLGYGPYGMSRQERQRIMSEELVRMEARQHSPADLALQLAVERNHKLYEGDTSWNNGMDEERVNNQAKAVVALMLLGAMCQAAEEGQSRQSVMTSDEGLAQSKASSQSEGTDKHEKHEPPESSVGIVGWLVVLLLGGAGVYVIFEELQSVLKHFSEVKVKSMSKLSRANVICPHCGCIYANKPELVGVVVKCCLCNKEFVVQELQQEVRK